VHFSSSHLVLSASDLSAFTECSHRTVLDLQVAEGQLSRPGENELERKMLELRGHEHEARVLEHYRAEGRDIVTISGRPGSSETDHADSARATEVAMQAGADVVYQGVLFDGAWLGRPDFLVKVPGDSRFGSHAYEVVDAKFARQTKARAMLQLCVYTDRLGRLQERMPESFWIVPGGDDITPQRHRAADYMAYYRQMKGGLEAFTRDTTRAGPYPEPVEHCDVCPWWKRCEERRRADDHLSLVAGITRRQRDRLGVAGVSRVVELAGRSTTESIEGIGRESFERIQDQAALQVLGRGKEQPIHKLLLNAESGTGLELLPEPTPGDLFLDLEGDPFVRGDGLEYLFGLLELGEPSDDFVLRDAPGEPRYLPFWAANRAEEKRAFEAVMDRIMRGLDEFRGLHVYHFGHRENDALKTLSCRHHTREDQVDELLRRHVLVDLHRVVKQAVRASVEAYTLKDLERLYGFRRRVERRAAARAMQLHCWWLETGENPGTESDDRATLALYNEDDCRSTWQLREWLEQRRPELSRGLGRVLTRPEPKEGGNEKREQASEETARVAARLTTGLPEDPANDDDEQRATRLLASLLDWHWREAKSSFWEYYRTLELPRDERLEDRAVLGGMHSPEDLRAAERSRVYRYRFPEQEHSIRTGDEPIDPDTGKGAGTVVDVGGSHVDIKRNPKAAHPTALIKGGPPSTTHHRARLLEIGRIIAERGFHDHGEGVLARELLLRRTPTCGQGRGAPLLRPGADTVLGLCDLALRLDGSVLAVQGPPGSGKTYRAARMIAALVRAGKRVGVTANSHKVITSLISGAVDAGRQESLEIRAAHIPGSDKAVYQDIPNFELEKEHGRALAKLGSGEIHVLGGTTWAWSREEFKGSVDVLVVDEASQMSLANALAVSLAAKNLVLLGDPAQLDQPQKGVHPNGADVSALEHLLGDSITLPDDRGVFLAETRRLPPSIREFTSTVFYEGRLKSIDGLEKQRITGPGVFNGSGLCFVPVEHRGNTNRSEEEVERIGVLVDELLASRAKWLDRDGTEHDVTGNEVLVVAPYNAQVAALRRRLPDAVAVGTVDRFQGQEAPIVLYSMTSSSAEDAPRGMEFLYSLNRLNVATSRAQALVVLVASPELTRVRCRTPRQMKLANALCAYLERAP
jgi:predicted RecB family nuclease